MVGENYYLPFCIFKMTEKFVFEMKKREMGIKTKMMRFIGL